MGTYKYQGELSEVSYIHNSYNATPVIITDGNASTTQVIKRSVWGEMLNNNYNENSQVPTEFGLTGHKWDEQSELTYAHARFLSNKNKVWLSNDPMSITGFSSDYFVLNPQYQNSYSYVGNNPVNNVDPDGKAVYIYTKVTQADPRGTHSFLYVEPEYPEDFKNILAVNGQGFTLTGGVQDGVDGLLQGFLNDGSDTNVVKYGYGIPDSTPAVGPTTGQYPMREKTLVEVPQGTTAREFETTLYNEFKKYKNDAQYSFDSYNGYNCNMFMTTLLVNSGVKKLPYNGRDLPGLAPGFGKVIPSNYLKYDKNVPAGSGQYAGIARTLLTEAGIKITNPVYNIVNVVSGAWNKTLGK